MEYRGRTPTRRLMNGRKSSFASLLLVACAGATPSAPAESIATPGAAADVGGPKSESSRSLGSSNAPTSPPREGASGSTIKTVSCGNSRCKVGKEVCGALANGAGWACQQEKSSPDGWYACDDPSDCAPPLTCCRRFTSGAEVFECGKRDGNCAALPCAEPDGGHCPLGQQCTKGYCRAPASATCESGKHCPLERPYCVWSGAPACVAEAVATAVARGLLEGDRNVSGVYACTRPSDCGSERCCTSMGLGERQTACANNCDLGNTMLLCETVADCALLVGEHCRGDASCRQSVRCGPPEIERLNSVPPWMKICTSE